MYAVNTRKRSVQNKYHLWRELRLDKNLFTAIAWVESPDEVLVVEGWKLH